MEKPIIILIASLLLAGCINFNPKGNEKEQFERNSADTKEELADDSSMRYNPHLKFKNVPIDGDLELFVTRMQRRGFKVKEKTTDQAALCGDFADFKECTVYVETLTGKNLVSRISVCFPEQEQWEYLYGDYKHLKELLIAKYGKPSSCIEKFLSSYGLRPKDDNEKMYSVYLDNCKYETHFATEKGEIILWIEHESATHAFVMLSYKDKINSGIIKRHAINDL